VRPESAIASDEVALQRGYDVVGVRIADCCLRLAQGFCRDVYGNCALVQADAQGHSLPSGAAMALECIAEYVHRVSRRDVVVGCKIPDPARAPVIFS
jgi:hypothetical protein